MASRYLTSLSGLLLLAGGCDSLPLVGGDDDNADKAEAAAGLEEKLEAAKKEAVDEYIAANEQRIEARIAAESQRAVEAYKEQQASEAKPEPVAIKPDDRPLSLSNLRIKSGGGIFGPSTGMIEIRADAQIKEKVGASTYVHVKSYCQDGSRVFSEIGYLSADYTKPLEKYNAGDTAEVSGNLFSQGYEHQLSPCQMEFKLAGMGVGGLSVELGQGCWDGSEAKLGPCAKPIVAVAASGASKPVEVLAVKAMSTAGRGGHGLNLNYKLLFNTAYDDSARLTLKATCQHGGKGFVDVAQNYVSTGPFDIDAGEAIARNANLFWNSAFAFGSVPKLCDLTVARWTSKSGTYGDYTEEVLYDACLRDTTVDPGRCDGGTVTRAAPVSMSDTNAQMRDVKLTLTEPYGTPGKFQLDIVADLTLSESLAYNESVSGQVTCRVGSEKHVESIYLYGMDLYYLLPGETTRMTTSAFGGNLLAKPRSCQLKLWGGVRYGAGSSTIDLGSYCLKKGKTKTGKC